LKRRRKDKDLNRKKNNYCEAEVATQVLYTIEFTEAKLLQDVYERKYLLSITGLGYIAVAELLDELGCFKIYRSVKQVIKTATRNPTELQSAGKKKS